MPDVNTWVYDFADGDRDQGHRQRGDQLEGGEEVADLGDDDQVETPAGPVLGDAGTQH